MKATGALIAAALALGAGAWAGSGRAAQRALVLGVAQDGGFPHIGCEARPCQRARREPAQGRRVACLGLIDEQSGQRFLIDATPDLPAQLEALNAGRVLRERARPVDGILLTHAHVGHYAGLMYLGREALGARGVPVYASPRMCRFLRENGPWSQLVALRQIELVELEPGRELRLSEGLRVTPFVVPHRDEFSDTLGYRVAGPRRSLLYIPDIDKWERWDRRIEELVRDADVALLDGTFESPSELPGRGLAEIPHPLVSETLARLGALRERLLLIHLNHSNRLLWDAGARRALERTGARVAREGQELPL